MVTIDKTIREAIIKAAEEAGNVLQLSKIINKSHTAVRDWISGETKRCSDEVFSNLLPLLEPYLPKERRHAPPKGQKEMKKEEIGAIVAAVLDELERRGLLAKEPEKPGKAKGKTAAQGDDDMLGKLLELIEAHNGRISRAELLYRSHLRDREFNRALTVLAERGAITIASESIQAKG